MFYSDRVADAPHPPSPAFPTATLDNLAPSLPLAVPSPPAPLFHSSPPAPSSITLRLNDSWLPQYCIVRTYSQNVSPKRRSRWRFLSVSLRYRPTPFQYASAKYFSEPRVQYVERLTHVRRLIASYFRPAGKTGKLTARYIAGMKKREKERGAGKGEKADELASKGTRNN